MLDKSFTKWWLGRVHPYVEVPEEKLLAEREAVERMKDFNDHYLAFLRDCVFPAMDELTKTLAKERVRRKSIAENSGGIVICLDMALPPRCPLLGFASPRPSDTA